MKKAKAARKAIEIDVIGHCSKCGKSFNMATVDYENHKATCIKRKVVFETLGPDKNGNMMMVGKYVDEVLPAKVRK